MTLKPVVSDKLSLTGPAAMASGMGQARQGGGQGHRLYRARGDSTGREGWPDSATPGSPSGTLRMEERTWSTTSGS